MSRIFDALEHDWHRVSRQRHNVFRLRDARHAAGNAGSLGALVDFVRSAPPEQADRVLLCLVRQAVQGSGSGHRDRELAVRTLIQLLLPGTRRLARRWWALGDEDERAALAVGAVYNRICTYPLARRPGKVAANILMDAERELRHAARRAAAWATGTARQGEGRLPETLLTEATDHAAAMPEQTHTPHPDLELASVLRDATGDGGLTPSQAELIGRTRIGGERIPDLAAAAGLRPRTLWDRRQRAEKALIQSGGELAGRTGTD